MAGISYPFVRTALVLGLALLSGCASKRTGEGRSDGAAVVAPDADVARLSSSDFVERSHAAERLVARGVSALPALGAAGDVEVDTVGAAKVSTTEPVVRAILADLSPEALEAQTTAAWPLVRRVAAEELGNLGRWSAVPRLIERLEDKDERVRAAASSSLRRLTNEFIPYRSNANTLARAAGVRRWKEWWTAVGRARAAEHDGGGES